MKVLRAALVPLLPAAFALMPSAAGAAASCESLAAQALPNTKIDMAKSVPPGNLTVPGTNGKPTVHGALPAFCRIAATVRPSSDSDIKIEVWLPMNWNGKFQAVGNGGWSGSISYDALVAGLRAGYATASTDAGHQGQTGEFALGHPEKLTDYSWRAHHEMTLKGKALTAAYYGSGPRQSYFNGCSSGARQALKEVTLYPNEYDGVVAGDPANHRAERNTWQMASALAISKIPGGTLSANDVKTIHDGVVKACDAVDGVKDGLIENPRACKFDVAALTCKAGQTTACLTPAQVKSSRILLSPGKLANGQEYQPGLEISSEVGTYGARLPGWSMWTASDEEPAPADNFKFIVYKDAKWGWRSFDAEKALPAAQKANAIETAEAADLAKFLQRGGKIVFYHGWADPSVAPQATMNYVEAVKKVTPTAADSVRLFMVPGMGHCRGGEGVTDQFDAVAALDTWVTQKKAPQQILARHMEGGRVVRTRPLCPFPQAASYKGTGSTDDAANFTCKAP
jgi:feruloyl esterase